MDIKKKCMYQIGDVVVVTPEANNSIQDDCDSEEDFKDYTKSLGSAQCIVTRLGLNPHESGKHIVYINNDGVESPNGYYEEELVLIRKKDQKWDD
jgi:hypothetical protein